jgi:hypothetical protein
MNKQVTYIFLSVVAALVIVVSTLLFAYKISHRAAPTSSSGGSITIDTDIPAAPPATVGPCTYFLERCEPLKTYVSTKLGLTFQVHQSAEIIERGNRILVGGEEGQYLEVYTKNPNQSLIDAVRSVDGPLDKCRLVYNRGFTTDVNGRKAYPETYEFFEVFSNEADWDRVASMDPAQEPLCQAKFMALNGERFYLADTAHPEKYLRVEIGQYSIPAGEELDWENTIRFQ